VHGRDGRRRLAPQLGVDAALDDREESLIC
jgi:hypothetical protein